MRIIHTSDWHLNDRLGTQSRRADITARIEQIAGYLKQRNCDLLIIAGDLFSNYNRLEEVRESLEDVNRILRSFLIDGGTILAISGNHDNEALFRLIGLAVDFANPVEVAGRVQAGRLYLTTRPTLLVLEDRAGTAVQFALFPYPTPARYLRGQQTDYSTLEERNRLLHDALTDRLWRMQMDELNPELPAVLVAHVNIRGSQTHNLYRITEREDVTFDPEELPLNWAYVALGHIHKPQALARHVRYSGSIERMDYGEREDEKSVVFLEIDNNGLVGEPELLPLDATPLYRIDLDSSVDLAQLKEAYPDYERALVSYRYRHAPGKEDRDRACRELEQLFARCYKREIVLSQPVSIDYGADSQDVRTTVNEYLTGVAANLSAEERADLLAIAEKLLLQLEVE